MIKIRLPFLSESHQHSRSQLHIQLAGASVHPVRVRAHVPVDPQPLYRDGLVGTAGSGGWHWMLKKRKTSQCSCPRKTQEHNTSA